MERVDVDGLTITYERAGSGPLLMLLHGYVGDGPTLWRHQIDEFSSDFTVVAWNAPGAGGSSDPPEEFVDTLLPTMFALPVAPEDLEAFRTSMEEFHPVGFRAMAVASAEDLRDVLPTVDVPTLLAYGDNDERAPMAVADHLHAAIDASRLVVLEGAGHVCNVELPQRFNDEVRAFLSSCGS